MTQEMRDAPLVIVAGSDTLVESVCRDLRDAGHRVAVVAEPRAGLRERIEGSGATLVAGSPSKKSVLIEAGIAGASALLALDSNDRVNLEIALQAREANPGVRIVLRQFNRGLAAKIEQNLPNCSVVSLAATSAATFAAAAVRQNTFLGLEFPSGTRSLVSFARRLAGEAGVAGLSLAAAEQHLACRILWRSEHRSPERPLGRDEEIVILGPLRAFARTAGPLRTTEGLFNWIARLQAIAADFDPLLRLLVVVGILVFLAATVYFGLALHLNPVTAAYFVTSTMTTVGYGDIALAGRGQALQIADIFLMISGVVISNLAIAFVAAALVRSQWNVIQGLRPIRDVGHIVVFGAGQVGTRVVDYLCDIHAVVTVVERNPTPELLRRARSREINLLTGDGTLDATLDLCNLGQARSAIVVTDSDSTNLEIGFGARARRSTIPVIMRIAEPGFAAAIRKHFEIRRAFSAAALAASAISDLVVTPSARGRVSFAGRSFRIAEYPAGSDLARDGTPLAAARTAGSVRAVRAWSDVGADDAVLVLLEADESRLKA